ncbi:TIR domain-containing protein [Bradyrhizobium lablabi]|uniref:TIR domain-containing protein n=1 Tax=Bradyrhizobium lablabi TaxID=722472 RepID=UPI001BA60DD4|nr:TIR domain-containing protein [Bradyrhizobium lablabi]MBR1121941.1 TIR domain-containing protein [Bradyrhizobium lablabi]
MAKALAMDKRGSLSASSPERKTRVFISYSRKDAAFADTLVTSLNARGFEAFLDKKDILPGEPWKERIGALILTADAVIFVVSPDSIASNICAWEIEEAGRLQKKLLPVLRRDVDDSKVPPGLSRLNYIFIRESDDFDTGIATLDGAIDTDIAWIRQHTRISELTRRWEDANRRDRGLLSGEDILEAERWRDSRPREAPPPTEAQLAYITASRQAATRRQRYLMAGSSVAAAIGITLAIVAYLQRQSALENEARAVKERDQALTTQSRFLADLAHQRAASGDEVTAMLLSLEALPGKQGERPFVPEAEVSLYAGRFGRGERLREIAVLTGHNDEIQHVAFSPDGARIVSGSLDKTARLWNATTGASIAVLKGHNGKVEIAAFSQDNKRIVTASSGARARIWDGKTGAPLGIIDESVGSAAFVADGTRIVTTSEAGVRLWSAETAKPIAVLEKPGASATAAVSPDGLRIVTTSAGATARLWNAATAAEIAVLKHESNLRSVNFNANGTRLITTSEDKTAQIWDGRTGAKIGTFRYDGAEENVWAVISPDGSRLVTSDSSAILWDVSGQAKLATLSGHENPMNGAAFSPDGTRLFTKSVDAVRLWDARTGIEVRPLKGHTGLLMAAAFSNDGKLLITASEDKTARVWDAKTGEEITVLGEHDERVWLAEFSPDNTRIVTQSGATLRLWSIPAATGVVVRHDDDVNSAAFSPDGKRILTASSDGTARLWDANTGAPLVVVRHEKGVNSAAFSHDGKRIVTGSKDGTVGVWDSSSGSPIASLKAKTEDKWVGIQSVAFSPDGARVVASGYGKTRLWDIEKKSEINVMAGGDAAFTPDGRQIMLVTEDGIVRFRDAVTAAETGLLETNENPISAFASPDGTRMVTTAGSETGDARAIVWDMRTKTRLAVARSENGQQFDSAAFSPDGSRILIASQDQTARIWDAATAVPVAVLRMHQGAVRSVAFSPNGTRVVTASSDKTARISQVFLNTNDLIEQAKQDVTRCLTIDERHRFFLQGDPPAWCIEMEKWPYVTPEWKTWLAAKVAGKPQPAPAQ